MYRFRVQRVQDGCIYIYIYIYTPCGKIRRQDVVFKISCYKCPRARVRSWMFSYRRCENVPSGRFSWRHRVYAVQVPRTLRSRWCCSTRPSWWVWYPTRRCFESTFGIPTRSRGSSTSVGTPCCLHPRRSIPTWRRFRETHRLHCNELYGQGSQHL